MANVKIIKGSELPIISNLNKATFLGYEDKDGNLVSGRIDFSSMTPLFAISQEITEGDLTHAPSGDAVFKSLGKLTDETNAVSDKLGLHVGSKRLHLTEIDEPGFAVCDIDGNAAFRIGENGVSHLNLDGSSMASLFKHMIDAGFAISDKDGNASVLIDGDGMTDLVLKKSALKRLKNDLAAIDGFLTADYNHIVTYGQSLGEGTSATPVLTTSPFSTMAKKFNHGLRTRFATEPKYQSFVPHTEQLNGGNGETPAAGTADMFIITSGLEADSGKFILSTVDAVGAQSLANLSKGTEWYNNILTDVTNAKRIAEAEGKSYRLTAVTWTQGEYNYGSGKEYYKQALTKLRADLIADVEAITGDSYYNLPFIMYQVSSSWIATESKDYPDVALAQYELAAEDNNGFYMATPIYHLVYNGNTDWHLTNASTKYLGAYYGYVLYQVLSGVNWKPLCPISHTISGNAISLKMSKSGLVFEKPSAIPSVVEIANRGFSVKDSSGTELIQSVELESDDTIKITCSASPAGLKLTYGFAKLASNYRNAGEVRDSQAVRYLIDTNYTMRNWCVIFERQL